MEQVMDTIKMELCKVLKTFAQNGINNASDVATVKHALSGISKIRILEEMDKYNEGYSHKGYHSYDGDGSYRNYGGYHRYSHDDGHSMKERLEKMMGEAKTDRERMAIQDALQKM